jgi:hypothetical protein
LRGVITAVTRDRSGKIVFSSSTVPEHYHAFFIKGNVLNGNNAASNCIRLGLRPVLKESEDSHVVVIQKLADAVPNAPAGEKDDEEE